jgi:hypothetical protein
MPVEITLPLTPLEQAVADARANEQVMAAKVEDAKLTLKAAKTAWEEAVGALMLAVDEMIRDKKQPSIPFGDEPDGNAGESGPEPDAPAPAGEPNDEPVAAEVSVTFLKPLPSLAAGAVPVPALPAAQSWRALPVSEHLDGPSSLFDTLDLFGVQTMGELADALLAGRTFNLKLVDVQELEEAVEQVSADDAEPIRFQRADETDLLPETGADEGAKAESAPAGAAAAPDPFAEPIATAAPEPVEPTAEEKPAKKGRKKKATAADLADL